MLGSIVGGLAGLFGPKQQVVKFDSKKANKELDKYLSSVNSLYSDIPKTSYTKVNATDEASKALGFNMSNMGGFQTMASQVNQTSVNDKLKALSVFAPQWQTERDQASNINQSWMRGEVSADTQSQLARNAALSSVITGQSSGPSAARGVLARDLGLTSTQLQQQGQTNSRSWTELNNSLIPQQVSAFDIMQQSGLSTQQALSTAISNSSGQLQSDMGNQNTAFQTANQKANAQLNLTEGKLAVMDKAYSAALTASGVEQQNAMAPWKGVASIAGGIGSMFGLGGGGMGGGSSSGGSSSGYGYGGLLSMGGF